MLDPWVILSPWSLWAILGPGPLAIFGSVDNFNLMMVMMMMMVVMIMDGQMMMTMGLKGQS